MTKKNEEHQKQLDQQRELEVQRFLQERLHGRPFMWFNSKSIAKRMRMTPIYFSRALVQLAKKRYVKKDGKVRYIFYAVPQEEKKNE